MTKLEERQDPNWVRMAAEAHTLYVIRGMEAVRVNRGRVYKSINGEDLVMDVYCPPGEARSGPFPAVILVHGGPIPGNLLTPPTDWGLFQSLARLAGASGLAAIMFNHRFFGPDWVRDAIADLGDLVAYVRAEAETLGVDGDRLGLWVFSGGGVLVSGFLRIVPPELRCVVAYYAALHGPTPEFSAAAQLALNDSGLPPLLVARSGLDAPQLNEGIDHFVQEALKKNAPLELLNHATGQHGFDFRDDNDRTRQIVARTFAFLGENLPLRSKRGNC